MVPSDAKSDLASYLTKVGFDFDSPNLKLGWEAFCHHMEVPVEGLQDYVMVELGNFSNLGEWLPFEPAFVVDLCRQFEFVDSDGNFDRYEQLHLTFFAPPSELTNQLKGNYFAEAGPSIGSFFTSLERNEWFPALQAHSFSLARVAQWVV